MDGPNKQTVDHVPAPFFNQLYMDRDTISIASDPSPTSSQLNHQPPITALVVGGSIGGIVTAIALHSIGCQVHIFESKSHLKSQGAGLVIQPDMAAFLDHFNIINPEEISVKSSGRQYVDVDVETRQGVVIGGNDTEQLFSAWDVLYNALKSRAPAAAYHAGSDSKVIEVQVNETNTEHGEPVIIVKTQDGALHKGDLLIGADGSGSFVRSIFCPGVQSSYQGYIAWRGVCPESDLPQGVLEFLGRKFTVYQGPNFHILAYLIPGEEGGLDPGNRRVNWVWYWNVDEDELESILLDKTGHRHGYSVPRGLLRDEVAEHCRQLAQGSLPTQLAELVGNTKEIFVQAIHDMLAPQLVFKDRVALVGDAGCILRPHTAAGTTKAAVNAWMLATCLHRHRCMCTRGGGGGSRLKAALEEYQGKMMELAEYLVKVGVTVGTQSQFPGRK